MQITSVPFPMMLAAISLMLTTDAKGGPQRFDPPPPGKATVILYRLRGIGGSAALPSMFANGDFVGDLRLANYATYEASQGHVVITAMMLGSIGLRGSKAGFPPPADWWPPGSPCERLDWRHLAGAKVEDIWGCKQYIRDWTFSHVPAVYNSRCGKMGPALAVLEAVATKDIPVGQQPISVEGGQYCSCFAGRLELEAEGGKAYYVEWYVAFGGAKMRLVDAGTGARKVRGLKPAENR